MSHLSCIGLVAKDKDEFMKLMDRVAVGAVDDAPAPAPASHVRWTDASGASMAIHLAARNVIDCITPYFVAPVPAAWRVRTTGFVDDEGCAHCGGADVDVLDGSGEMVTRSAVQWLHYQPFRAWLGEPREFALEVVAFAHRLAFYPSEAELDAAQESWWPGAKDAKGPNGQPLRFAAESFMPEGMFGGGGNMGERASVMFAGKVDAVASLTNSLCGGPFVHARIATLPGIVDVVAGAPEGTPQVGALAVVRAWLVGRPQIAAPPAPAPARRAWLRRVFGR